QAPPRQVTCARVSTRNATLHPNDDRRIAVVVVFCRKPAENSGFRPGAHHHSQSWCSGTPSDHCCVAAPPCRSHQALPVRTPVKEERLEVTDHIVLNAGDKNVDLPILKPTLGNDCVDVSKLTRETGLFTYDPGFGATASCKSAITYIDGDQDVLLYRGYPIEQLAEHSSFLEVAYLLMNGELPDKAEFSKFEHEVTHHTMMHESLKNFLGG